jgi:hypothetical protein
MSATKPKNNYDDSEEETAEFFDPEQEIQINSTENVNKLNLINSAQIFKVLLEKKLLSFIF